MVKEMDCVGVRELRGLVEANGLIVLELEREMDAEG